MCGIAGKISFGNKPIMRSDIVCMTRALAHRGPDGEGIFIAPNKKVGLGHRRLAVIDLSTHASQPMSLRDRYWIVFNGEIYNYKEKRKLLEKKGYHFTSDSDTEVIVALYDHFGKKLLGHLRGMFAFAIYDTKENTLFCARDRIGKKPFKYYTDGSVFMFASELKAILTQKEYHREPDYLAIHHFLSFQYCPGELTGFAGIKKLEPAHYLFLDITTQKIEIRRYWFLDNSKKEEHTENEWRALIIDKLRESVQMRMMADVPIGAFLSGGVDSSAIVAHMSMLSDSPIRTFSIGFDEKMYDERSYATLVADTFLTRHTQYRVKTNVIERIPEIVQQYEEPFADSSALPTYILSELTRKYVTVALNGDGGDENFAGYTRYSVYKTFLRYHRYITLFQKSLPFVCAVNSLTHTEIGYKIMRRLKSFHQDPHYFYAQIMSIFTNSEKEKLYTDTFLHSVGSHDSAHLLVDIFKGSNSADPLDQVLHVDTMSYLPHDLLVKVDMASMAHSLECRSPLLDHEFMELVARVPSSLKLKGLKQDKYIFKKALVDILPREILSRHKMGFGVPIDSWFCSQTPDYVASVLLSKKAISRNLFDTQYIRTLVADHSSHARNNASLLWALVTLEHWFQIYFD